MFVCLGNICRSPLAEYVFRDQVSRAGLTGQFDIESSGTGSWHVGELADRRMSKTADVHGIVMKSHRASQFSSTDLSDFDVVLVMDENNLRDVRALDRTGRFRDKVKLFREYDPDPDDYQVPDPYYGGASGFEHVFQIVERTSANLLSNLIKEHDLKVVH